MMSLRKWRRTVHSSRSWLEVSEGDRVLLKSLIREDRLFLSHLLNHQCAFARGWGGLYLSSKSCLSVCPCVCLCVCLSISVRVSVCPSVCQIPVMRICLSVCLSIRLSSCVYVCLSVRLLIMWQYQSVKLPSTCNVKR